MMPGSNGSGAEDWREIALMWQQTFCETLGASDWDSYCNFDLGFMPKKVGYALFGPPIKDSFGYSDTEMKEIRQICRKIMEQDDHRLCEKNSEIWMAIIFVCLALESEELTDMVIEPVFRVPKYSTENKDAVVFIDRYSRVYKNWEDYLQNNTLPSCSYCYPKNGIYALNLNNVVEIVFGNTPACKFTSKFFRNLDQVVPPTRLSIGLAAVGMAVPVNIPIVIASFLMYSIIFSLYGVCRDLYRIFDRITHNQSIALTTSEARNIWVNLAGNIVGILSLGITMVSKAQSGNTPSTSETGFHTSLKAGSEVIQGFLAGNEIPNVTEKGNKPCTTCLDITNLISSVLFFGHSVLNTEAAFKAIDNFSKKMQEHNITSIRKVKYNFRDNVRRPAMDSKTVRFLYFLNDISLSFLNSDNLFCPKMQYYNSHFGDNTTIIESSSKFKHVILNAAKTFQPFISNICSIGDSWKYLQEFGEINIPMLLQLGEQICNDLNYSRGRSICNVFNLVYMFVKNVVNDLDKQYREQSEVEKKLMGTNFCQSSFYKKCKILGTNDEYFCAVVLCAIELEGEIINILKDACRINCKETIVNDPVRTDLPTAMEKVVSWSLRDSDLQDQISKTQVLQIARHLTNENINLNNCVVAYAKSNVFVLIEDDSVNLNVIKLKCCVDDQIIVAKVMC